MTLVIYLLAASTLLASAFAVFRIKVRHDYRGKGRLTPFSSLLELLIWGMFFCFPYIYNPADWPWSNSAGVRAPFRISGSILVSAGIAFIVVTMLWFGIRRAFGLEVNELIQSGPYRICRNPQIVGGALLVVGSCLLLPSWYALGWAGIYGLVAHMMVLTEEEHLRAAFGERYERYCQRVPRYLRMARLP